MEIYRLKDEVPEKRRKRGARGAGFGGDGGLSDNASDVGDAGDVELVITEMRQGVRDENRVNVFVNSKFAFSLDVAQVVELGVKVGQTLTKERLAELLEASKYGKLYQRTLEWVLTRTRSVRETKDYLRKKIFERKLDTKYGEMIIKRLIDKGYLDDRRFAEFWVENRFTKKGVSAKRLKMELIKKGVSREIIDEVVDSSGRDEAEEVRKMIARKRTRYNDEKLVAYLCRQGFSYDLVRELVQESSEAGPSVVDSDLSM